MIAFAAGLLGMTWWMHQWASLPVLATPWVLATLLTAIVLDLALRLRGARLATFAGFLSGAASALVLVTSVAGPWLERAVIPALDGAEVTVVAHITSLPEHDDRRSRFRVSVESVRSAPAGFRARKLLVTRYPAHPELRAGQRWVMTLRLRAGQGPGNPGGFDRAGWYYREGLHGSATLLELESAGPREAAKAGFSAPALLHRIRGWLRSRLEAAGPGLTHPGLIHALVIGDRQGMTDAEWQAFLRTGTNHLMAISGLHVGLVAGFAGLLAGLLWRHLGPARRRTRRDAFMAVAGLLGATLYAALAGFSIPTQRALLMLAAFMGALLWRREPVAWRGLLLAAMAVVILHPASVLAAGFWFSFGAVAVILLLLHGRIRRPGWREVAAIQVMLALAMLPLSLAWFELGSWVAPLANLLAVPVISLVVLPLLLTGAGLAAIWPALALPLLYGGDAVLGGLVYLLDGLGRFPVLVDERAVPLAASLLGGLAVLLAMQPRLRLGAPWVLLAAIALVLPPRPELPPATFRAQLLDVGEGQAVLVRTRHHNLLFDAGYGREGGYSAGAQVVVPALRAEGVRRLQRMILSHEHAAHAGGAPGVQEAFPVGEVLRRNPSRAGERECRAGKRWTWDGVRFELIHPPAGWDASASASCVLAVESAGVRFVVTGGLGGLGQAVLLRQPGQVLAADVLVVPRGAGPDSLARGWLEASPPGLAWASTGRHGEGLAATVRRRLAAACVPLQETGTQGALRLEADTELRLAPGYRSRVHRFWQPTNVPEWELPGACEASPFRPMGW